MYLTPLCCFFCILECKAPRIPREKYRIFRISYLLVHFWFNKEVGSYQTTEYQLCFVYVVSLLITPFQDISCLFQTMKLGIRKVKYSLQGSKVNKWRNWIFFYPVLSGFQTHGFPIASCCFLIYMEDFPRVRKPCFYSDTQNIIFFKKHVFDVL